MRLALTKGAVALLLPLLLVGCHLMPKKAPPPASESTLPPIVAKLSKLPTGEYYQQRIKQFREENATLVPGGVVFCGDSITFGLSSAAAFAEDKIINRGISGDGLAGLLQRLSVSAIDLNPRKLFLLIGINDAVFSDYTLADYEQCYDYILTRLKTECPDCGVFVQSVLPVKGKYAAVNPKVVEINQILRKLARRHGMKYVDLHKAFCDQDGEMRAELASDGVHPNAAGYQLWHAQIRRFLR